MKNKLLTVEIEESLDKNNSKNENQSIFSADKLYECRNYKILDIYLNYILSFLPTFYNSKLKPLSNVIPILLEQLDNYNYFIFTSMFSVLENEYKKIFLVEKEILNFFVFLNKKFDKFGLKFKSKTISMNDLIKNFDEERFYTEMLEKRELKKMNEKVTENLKEDEHELSYYFKSFPINIEQTV